MIPSQQKFPTVAQQIVIRSIQERLTLRKIYNDLCRRGLGAGFPQEEVCAMIDHVVREELEVMQDAAKRKTTLKEVDKVEED